MQEEVPYRVESMSWPTPVIAEMWLTPLEGDVLMFEPGQYVLLNDHQFRVPPRSYSIANAPRGDGKISVLITKVDGGETSSWAVRREPGDEVVISGPFGTFTPTDSGRLQAFLAAGSGFAPARSLIESARLADRLGGVVVVMSARNEDHLIDAANMVTLEREHPGFRYIRTLTRAESAAPVGRLPAQLAELVPDIAEREIYASGPPGFVRACADAARDAGAQGTHIHTEEFYFEPHPWNA